MQQLIMPLTEEMWLPWKYYKNTKPLSNYKVA